jgi:CPA2 family monovalent cation:H+ antiporter-2
MLAERLELGSAHGRQIMGVALFQDLAVVPLLILIPALGNASERIGPVLWVAAAKAAVALILLLGLGKVVIRRWFLLVARDKSSELFVLNVLLVTLGLAYVTHLAGVRRDG